MIFVTNYFKNGWRAHSTNPRKLKDLSNFLMVLSPHGVPWGNFTCSRRFCILNSRNSGNYQSKKYNKQFKTSSITKKSYFYHKTPNKKKLARNYISVHPLILRNSSFNTVNTNYTPCRNVYEAVLQRYSEQASVGELVDLIILIHSHFIQDGSCGAWGGVGWVSAVERWFAGPGLMVG